MKLLTYRSAAGPRAGVLVEDRVVDVATLLGDPDRLAQLTSRGRKNAERFRWSASAAEVAATVNRVRGS